MRTASFILVALFSTASANSAFLEKPKAEKAKAAAPKIQYDDDKFKQAWHTEWKNGDYPSYKETYSKNTFPGREAIVAAEDSQSDGKISPGLTGPNVGAYLKVKAEGESEDDDDDEEDQEEDFVEDENDEESLLQEEEEGSESADDEEEEDEGSVEDSIEDEEESMLQEEDEASVEDSAEDDEESLEEDEASVEDSAEDDEASLVQEEDEESDEDSAEDSEESLLQESAEDSAVPSPAAAPAPAAAIPTATAAPTATEPKVKDDKKEAAPTATAAPTVSKVKIDYDDKKFTKDWHSEWKNGDYPSYKETYSKTAFPGRKAVVAAEDSQSDGKISPSSLTGPNVGAYLKHNADGTIDR